MEIRQCAACGHVISAASQVPQQCYCAAPACQRERRRRWQQAKRQSDPDYHDNQSRAQRAWRKRNPDYWREYRRDHPQYTERNRTQQRERNDRRREPLIAKMDASTPVFPIALRHIPDQPSAAGRNCKDGRVDGQNHLAFNAIRSSRGVLQREDVIGASRRDCYRGAF